MISHESPLFPRLSQSQERRGSWNPIHPAERDFQAEGLGQWKVLLSVEGQLRVPRQWSCVPARENHLLPTGEMPPCSKFCLWSANALRSIQCIYETLQRYCLYQYFISLPVSVDKSETFCENMGVLISSIALRNLCQPYHFQKGASLSEPLWRGHVRNNRFMWYFDILKKLDTLLLLHWGQIQSPPKSMEWMQVFSLQHKAWREKKSPFTTLEPPSSSCSF